MFIDVYSYRILGSVFRVHSSIFLLWCGNTNSVEYFSLLCVSCRVCNQFYICLFSPQFISTTLNTVYRGHREICIKRGKSLNTFTQMYTTDTFSSFITFVARFPQNYYITYCMRYPYLIIGWEDEVLGPGGIWGRVQGVGSDK